MRRNPKQVVFLVSPVSAPSSLGNYEQLREGGAGRVDRATGRTVEHVASRLALTRREVPWFPCPWLVIPVTLAGYP